jgi:hypothetical protein
MSRTKLRGLLVAGCTACLLAATSLATASSTTDFRIYATNTVVIGHDSVVTNLDVGSNNSVQLQGAAGNVAQVVNNVRTGQLI